MCVLYIRKFSKGEVLQIRQKTGLNFFCKQLYIRWHTHVPVSLPLPDPYKTTEQSGGWVLHRDEYILEKIQYISCIQTQISWSIQYFYLIPAIWVVERHQGGQDLQPSVSCWHFTEDGVSMWSSEMYVSCSSQPAALIIAVSYNYM